jgi:hypothetical protein
LLQQGAGFASSRRVFYRQRLPCGCRFERTNAPGNRRARPVTAKGCSQLKTICLAESECHQARRLSTGTATARDEQRGGVQTTE